MMKTRRDKLVGAVVSLPTFCDQDHNLLLDRQRKHIRWLIDHGIREGTGVLLIAGGYGEGYFLEDSELFALIDVLVDEAGGEVPTMVGIFDLSARTAARRARYAGDAGIDFLELGLPHYSCPSEDDVFLYHQYITDHADIGIMTYNNFWVTPAPGFEISRSLMERLADLDNMVGFKWSSASNAHYMGMLKLFADQFNFIDNGMTNALGARLGIRGFVDFYGNVAPRLSLKKWELFKEGRYDELDELLYALHFDPDNTLNTKDAPSFPSVADGVFGHLRWRLLGLDAGPNFPAQAQPSEAFVEHARKVIKASGIMDWVDWDQSLVE
jgi:4-hydroxy-tetrahydrodipicolinate synthase